MGRELDAAKTGGKLSGLAELVEPSLANTTCFSSILNFPGFVRHMSLKKAEEVYDPRGRSYSVLLTSVFLVCSVSHIVAPMIDLINTEYASNQLGTILNVSFYLPGLFGAATFGILASFIKRKTLLFTIAILVGSSCILTATSFGFWPMIAMRILTGFASSGALPVSYSLIGDYFPAHQRIASIALLCTLHAFGIFVGRQCSLVFASLPKYAFLHLALAVLIAAVALRYYLDEPVRGSQEGTSEGFTHPASRRHQLKAFWSRTNFLLLQLSLGIFLALFSLALLPCISRARTMAWECLAVT